MSSMRWIQKKVGKGRPIAPVVTRVPGVTTVSNDRYAVRRVITGPGLGGSTAGQTRPRTAGHSDQGKVC